MAARRRRRALPAGNGRTNADAAEARVEAASRRLVKLLRQQAGIPVRLPAHAVPPFRAVPWNWSAVGQIEGVNDSLVQRVFRVNFAPILTTFGGGSVSTEDNLFGPANSTVNYSDTQVVDVNDATLFPGFPDGFLGWLTHVDVAAMSVAGNNFFLHRYVRWSLRVNGADVPGFKWTHASSQYQILNLGQLDPGTISPLLPMPCGLPLRPGSQVDIVPAVAISGLVGTFRCDFIMRANGYMIPSRTDDGTVYSTLVD